jgi:hypothetical protein
LITDARRLGLLPYFFVESGHHCGAATGDCPEWSPFADTAAVAERPAAATAPATRRVARVFFIEDS